MSLIKMSDSLKHTEMQSTKHSVGRTMTSPNTKQ